MDAGTSVVVGDEEDQQKISAILDELQSEVRELRDKTNQTNHDMKNANNTIELQEQKIRDLENRMIACEESKSGLQIQLDDLQHDIDQLKQHGGTSSTSTTAGAPSSNVTNSPSTTPPSSSGSPASNFFQRNITIHDGLPEDTFTLMNISPFRSQAWLLGLFTYAFQMVLICMIGTNQLQESIMSSDFNVPFKVDPVVRAGQFFTIIFALATQHDILSSVRFLVMFWNDPHWDRTLLGRDENEPKPTSTEWAVHILIPNVLKFVQGILVMLATFVVIVQSDNIIELLKDFTALMILSETDNIFFRIAANGYLGAGLQMKSMEARAVKIENESASSDSNGTPSSSSKHFLLRPIILLFITVAMIGGWLYIVINQANGTYFKQRYPECYLIVPNAFQLATEHFGDGICYGGPLNTLECEFEDGDCANFNTAYPLCKGDDRTNAQKRVGDGDCDTVFMNADCDYDGGDCCPYINDPSFGDGTCDEEMNTEGCGYDNGDCITYNRDFAGCPFDIVHNNTMFGDGQCNGGIISTSQCGYDNGDCNPLRIAHPDCPFDDLSNITGANDVILGDGICDSGIYTMKECGFEYGDCHQGQVGQTIFNGDDVRSTSNHLYFSKVLSLDGSTLALGLYHTDEDGRYSFDAPGVVKVWRFNRDKKLWLRLGGTIESPSGKSQDSFGYRMSMSDNGNHLAISSTSGLNVFKLNDLSGNEEWIQVGQTLKSTSSISIGIISSDGSRAALIYDVKEIRIYNLETIPDGQTWMHDDDLDVIEVDDIRFENYVELRFAPSDGSILLFSDLFGDFVRIFQQSNPDVAWMQIGQDIGKASLSSSIAIASNGTRIGVRRHSTDTSGSSNNGQDEVQVLDYNGSEWLPVGSPIMSSSLNDGQEFGYSVDMSDDGNLLLVGLNHPDCHRYLFSNAFVPDKCTKSSGALFELYTYQPENNRFVATPLRKGVKDTKEVSDGSILHGLHFSLGNGDNGSTLLSVSNYNLDDNVVFFDVIDLDELYYTKCAVNAPDLIGDGQCHDFPPYITEACGFDGGDCERNPVDGYPHCFVHRPHLIGDGRCDDWRRGYNTTACGFDGGDCL